MLIMASCQNSVNFLSDTHRDLLNIKGRIKSTTVTAVQLSFSEDAMDYVIKAEEKTFYGSGSFNKNDLLANGIGCEKYDYVDNVDPLINLFFDYGNIYKNIVFDNTLFFELNKADNLQLEFNEEGDITKVGVFIDGLQTIDYVFEYNERNSIKFEKIHNWIDPETDKIERSSQIVGTIEFNDLNLISNFIYALDQEYIIDTISFKYDNRGIKDKKEITCRMNIFNDEKIINISLDQDNYVSHYVVGGTQYQFEEGRLAKMSGNNPFIIFEKSSNNGIDSIYINNGNGFSFQSVKILRDENNSIKEIERNNPSGLDGCSIKYSLDNNGNWIELSYFRPPSELKEIIERINYDIQLMENLLNIKRYSSYEEAAGAEFDLMMKKIQKGFFINSKKKVKIIREIHYY
jgi:hypothetical protein